MTIQATIPQIDQRPIEIHQERVNGVESISINQERFDLNVVQVSPTSLGALIEALQTMHEYLYPEAVPGPGQQQFDSTT